MSETHNILNLNDFNIPGYNIISNTSTLNRCDGCVVYTKQKYFLEDQLLIENNLKIIRVCIKKDNLTLDIFATYRCFYINNEEFLDNLHLILQKFKFDHDRSYVFAGDINIDLLTTEANTTNNYLSLMQSYGFVSVINKPTRKVNGSTSCIDHYFVRCKIDVFDKINSIILEHSLTDHDPILLNITLGNNTLPLERQNFYQVTNHNKVSRLLERERWDGVLQHWNSDVCTSNFINKIKTIISSSTTDRVISSKKRLIKPWMTSGLLVSIRTRDYLKKKYTLNGNSQYLLNKYKIYRTMLSKLIKNAKYLHYKGLAQKNAKDPKKLWGVIREATGDAGCKTEIKNICNNNNIIITNKKEMANTFNEFFVNVGRHLADNIINSVPTQLTNKRIVGNRLTKTFRLHPISENDIMKQINKLKDGVKGGDDQINSNFIKKYKLLLIRPLCHITNVVFSTGVFPECLKTTVVVPLFKQGDRKNINNYRPIALTSTISKIIEKCFKMRLSQFLEKNNILNKNQFAFREDTSTENALCKVTETILKNLDQGKRAIGLFLDLKKAFDTVAHHILLKRLELIGIRGTPNDLINSYLTKRKQSVLLSEAESDRLEVDFGLPQGTVLSPLLFNIYINEIFNTTKEGEVFCFADDAGVVVCGDDWGATVQRAEVALLKIKNWLDMSLLSLNVDKTKFIAFSLSPRSLPDIRSLVIHKPQCKLDEGCPCDQSIERKSTLKYLGILIDENFTWKEQVNYVTNKIRKVIFKFYELRNILPFKILKLVYYAVVESIINYGLVVWGSAGATIMTKLHIAQKWIIKLMLFKNRTYPTHLLYKDSNLLTPNQLFIKSIIRYMLKSPEYKQVINHNVNTRIAVQNNLVLQQPKHTVCQSHIYCVGPRIYNDLPIDLRSRPYYLCKKDITKWLLENNYSIKYIT